MRIGIDARFYHPEAAGLARYSSELLARLINLPDAERDQFVILLPPAVDPPATQFNNVKFITTGIKHYSFAEQTRLKRLLKAEGLDLTHFLHFNHPLTFRGASVFTIHDLILNYYPGRGGNPFRRLAYRLTLYQAMHNARHLIAVSHATKRQIMGHYRIPEDRISVIYEAVGNPYRPVTDQHQLSEVKARHHLERPFLLYVGQWREHKNLVRLIEAFTAVKAKMPQLQLAIAGKPDRRYPEILQAIEQRRLNKSVIILGFVPENDLPALYSGAEAAVVPSLMEGFGLPSLEAMACACPVVSSNASCLPEIAGEAAFYFDPLDAVDIADKILAVITNPGTRRLLIEAGQKRAEDFSWQKAAQETLDLYHTIN